MLSRHGRKILRSFGGLPRRELLEVIILIVGTKVLIWVFSFVAVPLFGAAPDSLSSPRWFLDVWHKWDAWWYTRIAETGYPATGEYTYLIAFLPLFPLLTRLVSIPLHGDAVIASLIVANVLSGVGFFLFYVLARREFGPRVGWYSLAALLFFPSGYIFSAGYSEAPYLLFTVGAFYFARQARWATAGIFGLLAAATRLAGVFLLPALLVEFFLQSRERALQKYAAAWLLLIPAGLLFYVSLNHTLFGDPLAFREIIDNRWQRELTWPGGSFSNSWKMIGTFPYGPFEFNRGLMEIAGGVLFIAGTVVVLARLRFSYALFTLLSAVLVLSTSKLESIWRYMLASFPLFFVLGTVLAHSRVGRMLWWFVSISLFIIFLLLFVSGQGGY